MPAPSSALVTLRPDLEQSFTDFDLAMNIKGFVATRVAPVIDVDRASGNYGRIPLAQLLQSPDTARAPGSGYQRGKFTFIPETFATVEHGFEEPVDDNEAAIYADYFSAEQISALRAHHNVLMGLELRTVAAVTNPSVWTGASLTLAVTNKWSSFSNATPMEDVETAIQAVWANSGLWPNTLVMHQLDFRNLRRCAEIQNLIKFSGFDNPKFGAISAAAIAEVLGIENLIIAGAAQNTANDGQNVAIASAWPAGSALVARVATSSDIREPCVARIFNYTGDGGSINGTVESYREEQRRSNIIRVRQQTGETVLYPQAAFLLTNVR